MKVQGLRGTRDFFPEKMRELNYLFSTWKSVVEGFGYEEMDGPMLEPAKLWTLKSGDEIPEQMYLFKDKKGMDVAVRPELTPTLARMVADKQKALIKPIKWYSIPRCWRYEAPQTGRLREFFQLNVDCLGTDSMQADAEVIVTAINIMKAFGCTKEDFFIRLCNRKLISSLLLSFNIKKKDLQEVSRWIDKKEKLFDKDFIKGLKSLELGSGQIDAIKDMLKMDFSKVNVNELNEEGKQGYNELKELIGYLKDYNVLDFCKIDFSLMRGFDYYTSTVFEVYDASMEFRAIAGGGRYDDLVKDFGGDRCPGVGYGMGDVVLGLFLLKKGKMPNLQRDVDYYIAPVSKEVVKQSIKIANKLRKKFRVELDLSNRKLKKQFDYADAINAAKIVIIGERDLKLNKVTIRDMKTGKEKKVKISEL